MESDKEFVKITDVSKNFGSVKVLFDISFSVKRGEIISLLGPSGCGKTTLLRCVSGLESPEKGISHADESPLYGDAIAEEVLTQKPEVGADHFATFDNKRNGG